MFDWLFTWFYELLYALTTGICKLAQWMYEIFEVFAGLEKVQYKVNGVSQYFTLIEVFFKHRSITKVYWCMAMIGIVLCFGFGIIAVIRKMFDSSDKMQTTLGQIVGSVGKSILIILLLNVIMTVVLDSTNTLLQQISYSFDKVGNTTAGNSITFSEEDYATMARIYNTIGNYALNSSYNSRFNVNSCFNAIRKDMKILQNSNEFVYDFDYAGSGTSWQSVLVPIAHAVDIDKDVDVDSYNEGLMEAMVNAMNVVRTSKTFQPLSKYEIPGEAIGEARKTRLDAVLFMAGTTNAALNDQYNMNAELTDSLRYPYIIGDKDMYDLYETVEVDFDITEMNYVVIFLIAAYMCWQFFQIAINCVARIFNMLLLYLIAPPFIGASPLDGGGKMKQWTVAFVVQSLSVIGSIIAVKLLIMMIPIILSKDLILFPDHTVMNYFAKLLLIMAAALTSSKASGMVSGILADSAGWQSINAGDVGSSALGRMGKGLAAAEGIASTGKSVAKSALSLPGDLINGAKNIGQGVKNGWNTLSGAFTGGGGSSGPKNNNSVGSGSETSSSNNNNSSENSTENSSKNGSPTNNGTSQSSERGNNQENVDKGNNQQNQNQNQNSEIKQENNQQNQNQNQNSEIKQENNQGNEGNGNNPQNQNQNSGSKSNPENRNHQSQGANKKEEPSKEMPKGVIPPLPNTGNHPENNSNPVNHGSK